jgi:O-antigen/teichoic acid export membrane protein
MSQRSRWRAAAPHWGVIDQAISSGTNFVLLFLTVRSVSAEEFGAFSLVYLLYVLSVPLVRATAATPFTIRFGKSNPAEMAAAAARCLNYVVSLGVMLTVFCCVSSIFLGPPIRAPLIILGLSFPLLLAQDTVRGVLFAKSDFLSACYNDVVWAVVQFSILGALLTQHTDVSAWEFVAAWAAGGSVAGIYGFIQVGVRPRFSLHLAWLREQAVLAKPLFASNALTVLPAQLTYLLMPAVSSLTELGKVRAVYVLFGPLNVAYTAASMLALPHAVRLPPERVRGLAAKISIALGAFSLAWGVAILLLPNQVGRSLIGPVWDSTSVVRLLLALSLVAEGIVVGPLLALSALALPDRMARVRYLTAPLTLVAGLVLAGLFGAAGVAFALMAGYSLTALLAWIRVPGGRHHDSPVDGGDVPTPTTRKS